MLSLLQEVISLKKGNFKITYVIITEDYTDYVTIYNYGADWYYYKNGMAIGEQECEDFLDDCRTKKDTTIIRTCKEGTE